MDIVARILRNTQYGVCFLAENEFPHMLQKSSATSRCILVPFEQYGCPKKFL